MPACIKHKHVTVLAITQHSLTGEFFDLPAIHRKLVDSPRTPRRWSKTHSSVNNYLDAINICMLFERSVSKAPYLIHDATKAPHITGGGVSLVVNCLSMQKHIDYHSVVIITIMYLPQGLSTLRESYLHEKHSSQYKKGHVTSQNQQSGLLFT